MPHVIYEGITLALVSWALVQRRVGYPVRPTSCVWCWRMSGRTDMVRILEFEREFKLAKARANVAY